MKLYIGGCAQGKADYVRRETGLNPERISMGDAMHTPAIDQFHELIRQVVQSGGDAEAFALHLTMENPDAVVLSDEVGMGIVPMDRDERIWREAVGRALCVLARHAESVERISCGIGVRIK